MNPLGPTPDSPVPGMLLRKVTIVNLGILLLYMIILGCTQDRNWFPVLILLYFSIQGGLNLFSGLILLLGKPYKHVGKAMALIGLIMLLILLLIVILIFFNLGDLSGNC